MPFTVEQLAYMKQSSTEELNKSAAPVLKSILNKEVILHQTWYINFNNVKCSLHIDLYVAGILPIFISRGSTEFWNLLCDTLINQDCVDYLNYIYERPFDNGAIETNTVLKMLNTSVKYYGPDVLLAMYDTIQELNPDFDPMVIDKSKLIYQLSKKIKKEFKRSFHGLEISIDPGEIRLKLPCRTFKVNTYFEENIPKLYPLVETLSMVGMHDWLIDKLQKEVLENA